MWRAELDARGAGGEECFGLGDDVVRVSGEREAVEQVIGDELACMFGFAS